MTSTSEEIAYKTRHPDLSALPCPGDPAFRKNNGATEVHIRKMMGMDIDQLSQFNQGELTPGVGIEEGKYYWYPLHRMILSSICTEAFLVAVCERAGRWFMKQGDDKRAAHWFHAEAMFVDNLTDTLFDGRWGA